MTAVASILWNIQGVVDKRSTVPGAIKGMIYYIEPAIKLEVHGINSIIIGAVVCIIK